MEVAASICIPASVKQMRRGDSRRAQLQAANWLAELFAQTRMQAEPLAPLQAAFASDGGIEAAVRLLQSATPALRLAAASMLGAACVRNAECAAAVASAGGVSALLRLLREAWGAAQPNSDFLQLAAYALGACAAASPAAAQAAADAGGGQLVIELLQAALQHPEAHWWPIPGVLAAMAKLGEEHAADLAERGAIEALVQLLPRPGGNSHPAPLTVINALGWLAEGSVERAAAIADAGVVPALLQCLSSDDPLTQVDAAELLSDVMTACPHLRASVIETGGDSQLQRLLGSSDGNVRQAAAHALDALAEAREAAPDQPAASTAPGTPAQPARPPRICAAPGCGATTGLKRCGGCGRVRYCSTECSRAHWREHRAECRRLQA